MKNNRFINYIVNLIFPAVVFGSITGVLTGAIITIYKWCAKHIVEISSYIYNFLHNYLYLLPAVFVVLFGVSYLFSLIYKKNPNLRGGGIPTSIAILRGLITFRWLRNLIGIFFMSLVSFLVGVPLGSEGPSVQMGTALGRGSYKFFAKKHKAWDRYSMTGGACAGFAVATGAPISGIMFAIEEAHQRIAPMIIIVSATAVIFATIVSELLSPVFMVSTTLFPKITLISLTIKDVWIPIVVGACVGLFSVVFLKYYKFISKNIRGLIKNIPVYVKIFAIFVLTVCLGLISASFISTGHELILSLFEVEFAVWFLVIILLVRSTLTLLANTNGVTGGMFLPILAIGAVFSSIVSRLICMAFNLDQAYFVIMLVLGIVSCISGMMKIPLTAIVFGIEALFCFNNIFFVIIASAVSFVMTELFDAKSINESVIDNRIADLNQTKTLKVYDTFVTVQKGSFAVGKQMRDILWPANLFILSLQRKEVANAEVDEHGAKAVKVGDVLHVRYSTYDEPATKRELISIVGDQDYNEKEATII
ncbi:MAG: chloride channel protein [Clostridia bacterium]|nr:chloride channel protein [Clostridia bacterium]